MSSNDIVVIIVIDHEREIASERGGHHGRIVRIADDDVRQQRNASAQAAGL